MQLIVRLGNRLWFQQSVDARLTHKLRSRALQLRSVDPTVDHHVRDMDSLRPVLARETLRDRAQARFRGGEGHKWTASLDGGRGSREYQRSTARAQQPG